MHQHFTDHAAELLQDHSQRVYDLHATCSLRVLFMQSIHAVLESLTLWRLRQLTHIFAVCSQLTCYTTITI